jgi:hypothetical protein
MLQTPAALNPGDQFRFVFVTDGIRDATSTNIADYDSFVNAQAGGATYGGVVVNWVAIGSTASVDAIDHVVPATAPVYLSDGTLVTTTTNVRGLWSSTLVHKINLDLAANAVQGDGFIWTGTNSSGIGSGNVSPFGSARPQVGSAFEADDDWVDSGSDNSPERRPFYGISSILTVQGVPEPSALTMLATALIVCLAIGWARPSRDPQRAGRSTASPTIAEGQ